VKIREVTITIGGETWRCRECDMGFDEPHVAGCVLAVAGRLVDRRSCLEALPPPDGAEALATLRTFAELDIRDAAVVNDLAFKEDPAQFFVDAMSGLQVVVRAHLQAIDSAPENLGELALQLLLEAKAGEHDRKARARGQVYYATGENHLSKAAALREFAGFLRESRGAGTKGGT
jgi:hypothetical protein